MDNVEDLEKTETLEVEGAKKAERAKKVKRAKDGKKRGGIAVFIIGMVTLIVGVATLLVNLLAAPGMRDAEYLVEVGSWMREDESSVIWNFTEVGKGMLTTNDHLNDYDFIWAIAGDTLEVETTWFYKLENSYKYKIDQSAKTLTLYEDDRELVFVPATAD